MTHCAAVPLVHACAFVYDRDGSIVLARWLHLHPECTRDLVGLELGSGVGVPGIVAARQARRVVLTDYMEEVVANLAYNLALNANVELDEEDDEERNPVELTRRKEMRARVRASGRAALLDWHAINPDAEDLERMEASRIEAEQARKQQECAAGSAATSSAAAPAASASAASSSSSSADSLDSSLPPLSARLSSLPFTPSPHFSDPTGLGPGSCDFLLGSELIYTYNRHHQDCFLRVLEYYLKAGGKYFCVQSMNREGMPEFLTDLAATDRFDVWWQRAEASSGLLGLYTEKSRKPDSKEFVQREEEYVFYIIQKRQVPGVPESIDVKALSLPGGGPGLQNMREAPVPKVAMLRDAAAVMQHEGKMEGVTASGIGLVASMIPKAFAAAPGAAAASGSASVSGSATGAAAAPAAGTNNAAPSPSATEDAESGWEQRTTRKQRKQQAKAAAAAAPAAACAVSPDDADASFPVSAAPVAASSSSFPVSSSSAVDAADEDDESMAAAFLEDGFIGLDGRRIEKGTPLVAPPPPQPAAPAAAAASGGAGVTTSQGGAAGRRPRYAFDETQLPKCFICQTRHDLGQCRTKERL